MSHAFKAGTMKNLNSGHLRASKKLSFIEGCPLLGGNYMYIRYVFQMEPGTETTNYQKVAVIKTL